MILDMIVKRKLIQIGEKEIMCEIVGEMKDIFIGHFECTCHKLIMLMISRGVILHIKNLGDWLAKKNFTVHFFYLFTFFSLKADVLKSVFL